jgi:endo-1,4-beta-xylanase
VEVATSLPSGTIVINAWSADRSGDSGTVTRTDVGHNGSVPGGRVARRDPAG